MGNDEKPSGGEKISIKNGILFPVTGSNYQTIKNRILNRNLTVREIEHFFVKVGSR